MILNCQVHVPTQELLTNYNFIVLFNSECFGSNFVLFLDERDGLSKWAPI